MERATARRAVILVVWMACVTGLGVPVLGGPAIDVEEPVYDFGTVVEGATVEHTFEIENTGDEDLVIEDVRVSCGCTATELPTDTLIPSRVVRLSTALSTAGYGGLDISKRIYLTTNDPDHPEVTLTLRGRVVPEEAYLIEASDLSGSLKLLVDIRPMSSYTTGHLLGATNLPADEIDAWFDYLPKEYPMVLYDENGKQAGTVAEAMLAAGFLDVRVLVGGFREWIRLYGDRMVTTFDVIFMPIFDEGE